MEAAQNGTYSTCGSTDESEIDDKSIAWGRNPLVNAFAGSLGPQSQRMGLSTLLSQIDFDMQEEERLNPFVPRPDTSYEGKYINYFRVHFSGKTSAPV